MPDELDIEAIRKRVEAATTGPWSYNSYSRVDADAMAANWDNPSLDYPDDPRPCTVTGIAFDEADNTWLAQHHAAYEADAMVCGVPAEYGDTATGRHAADAEFIAHAITDIPLLMDEIEQLRTELADARSYECPDPIIHGPGLGGVYLGSRR